MEFEHRKDSGRLMASQSKKHEKAPDYWGEIAINVKDLTKVEQKDGLMIFRLNGWKKKSKTGAVYLSIAVDRWLPKGEVQKDEDIPF
jgi:hypothetical protein